MVKNLNFKILITGIPKIFNISGFLKSQQDNNLSLQFKSRTMQRKCGF